MPNRNVSGGYDLEYRIWKKKYNFSGKRFFVFKKGGYHFNISLNFAKNNNHDRGQTEKITEEPQCPLLVRSRILLHAQ